MIVVDTPIWSLALRRHPTALSPAERGIVREWEGLVRGRQALLLGPVRQELLSGVKGRTTWRRLRDALRAFPDWPIEREDYETASDFYNRCREKGVTGSAIDLVVCAVAARASAPIFTVDSDFARYSMLLGLRLHVAG